MTHRPNMRQRTKKKAPYPAGYRQDLARTRARAERRPIIGPGVQLEPVDNDDGPRSVTWGPVFAGDDDYWWLKLCDAFGTRSDSVVYAFMNQLIDLCGGQAPSQTMLNAALAIVGSYKPANEGEAMLAAQMVAVNSLTMKAAAYANTIGGQWVPEREAKLVFRGARTFAEQTETMARLKGRKGRQDIYVHYEDNRQILNGDVHQHRGTADFGTPRPDAYAARDSPDANRDRAPEPHAIGAPMRGADPERRALPGPEGEGTAPLPPSRLWAWIGRATRRSERLLQARGLDDGGEGHAPAAESGNASLSRDEEGIG